MNDHDVSEVEGVAQARNLLAEAVPALRTRRRRARLPIVAANVQGATTMFKCVLLRITNGELKGREFVLDDETRGVFGRASDCSLHLVDSSYRISRHHCQITVSAPHVRIQDLGSLNGTYVNGVNIGQRFHEQTFEDAFEEEHPEHPLWHGDRVQIGDTIVEVVFDPPPCAPQLPAGSSPFSAGG